MIIYQRPYAMYYESAILNGKKTQNLFKKNTKVGVVESHRFVYSSLVFPHPSTRMRPSTR
ncbi:hypothetical protein Hanom_Chr05g00407451 [Helianthus anomalus]